MVDLREIGKLGSASKPEKPNSLDIVAPEIAAEWHPTMNGTLKPTDITKASGKKVWWICPQGHEYPAVIAHRTVSHTGCPYCSGKKVLPGLNNLATLAPEIAAEWHPTKNGDLKPKDVFRSTDKKVWWKCPKGHEYQATIYSRVIYHTGCSYCSGKKVLPGFNDLATLAPEIAAEWHPTKNGDLKPKDVYRASSKKVWWKCSQDHEYQAAIGSRTINHSGCPYCYGNRVASENSLPQKIPELMKEWDYVNNYTICDPNEISDRSHHIVWWNCQNDTSHKYPMKVCDRVTYLHRSKTACPFCKGLRRKKNHII